MAGENQETRQPRKNNFRRTSDSTIGLIILALIVFYFVNGPGSRASERRRSSNEANFSETAVLSGVERHNNSPSFHGGDATAFMGGVKLDLRDAVIDGNDATIDVTSVMGGVELYIPRNWTVVNHVTPIMGGVDDHTHPNSDANKRLIVEGTVLMGGLQISN
ncbi:MAG TPA: LiaF domain-containing protein [Terriglobia bacterium]|nr:LiaF domain-containing protein [Terriglobia bacterium]